MLATLFGIGHLKPAPGTWGSLAAVIAALVIHIIAGPFALIAALFALLIVSHKSVAAYVAKAGDKDPSEVVLDELLGQWIAVLPVSLGAWHAGAPATALYPGWIAAFVLFRLFDIWKPWLVGRADRKGTPWGVIEDDLWAGLFAAIGTIALAAFAHLVVMP